MAKEKAGKVKKPIYKKWWFWVIIAVLVLGVFGSGGNDSEISSPEEATEVEEQKQEEKQESQEEKQEKQDNKKDEKQEEEKVEESKNTDLKTDEGKQAWVQAYFDEYIKSFGTLDHTTINADAGEGEGYIMLVYCSFDQKNKAETAKSTISTFAQDMAARVGQDLPDVNELCIFWEVPYLNSNAKTQFERSGNGMAIGDQVFNF